MGIQKIAAHDGLELDPGWCFQLPGLADPSSGFEGGLRLARKMLAAGRPFTAVIAFDDLTALGVVRGLPGRPAHPDDCSVMGFDDVLPAEVATPAMTTIRTVAGDGVGGRRAGPAGDQTRGRQTRKAPPVKPSPELVIRKSTASPPKISDEGSSYRAKGHALTVVT